MSKPRGWLHADAVRDATRVYAFFVISVSVLLLARPLSLVRSTIKQASEAARLLSACFRFDLNADGTSEQQRVSESHLYYE